MPKYEGTYSFEGERYLGTLDITKVGTGWRSIFSVDKEALPEGKTIGVHATGTVKNPLPKTEEEAFQEAVDKGFVPDPVEESQSRPAQTG